MNQKQYPYLKPMLERIIEWMNSCRSPKHLVCLRPRASHTVQVRIWTGVTLLACTHGPVQSSPSAHTREQLTMPSRKRGAKEEFGRTAKAWASRAGVRARPAGDTVRCGGEDAQMSSSIIMSGNILATCTPPWGQPTKGMISLNCF